MDKEEREQEMSKMFGPGKLAAVESIKVVESQEILLENTFRVWCRGRGKDYRVSLTPSSLILKPFISPATAPPPICCICPYSPTCIARCCSGPRIEIAGRDVVACRPAPNGGPFFPQGSLGKKKEKKLLKKMDPTVAGHPVFMLIAYPSKSKAGLREKMVLYFHLPPKKEEPFADSGENNNESAKNSDGTRRQRQLSIAAKVRDTWVHAIETSLLPEIQVPPYQTHPNAPPGFGSPKLLVIVNPFSGQKKSEKILQEELLPFFSEAGINFEVLITRYAGHAREVVANERLSDWRGLVTVSGDGLIHEVLNGLFDRVDWREALARLPIGVIPGGTGNALSRTLVHEQDEPFDGSGLGSAILNVVRGRTKPFDLFNVESVAFKPRVGFLSLCYGIIADIDIESEKLRYMGEARFTVYALQRIASLRTYRAKLWYLPASDYSELEKPREKSRPETVRKLEEDLKNGDDDEAASLSPESTSTGSDYEETGNQNLNADELSSASSRTENESAEREIPEITLEEEGFKSGSEGYKSGSGKKSSETNEDHETTVGEEVQHPEGEEVTVLPSDYQFLFNRFSYSNLLTQGHLYFRSWDELQYQVLGSVPEHSNPAGLAGGPPEMRNHPFDRSGSYNSDDESTLPERQGPKFRELIPLDEPLPTTGASNETASISSQDGSTRSFLDDWIYEEGEYVGISLINLPFLGSDSMLAPKSRTDDGILHLMIIRNGISKKNLVQMLIDMETGKHVNIPGVEIVPVRAIRLEPLGNSTQGGGIMTLDGEVVPTGLVQAHIVPSAAKVFIK